MGLGFDHRAEGVMAEGALLLEVDADVSQQFVGQGFIEQGAICAGSFDWVVAKGKPGWMGRQRRVRTLHHLPDSSGLWWHGE
ncbi:hypothetical protein GCM10009090_15390 [[Pseudomonas] boreopolis]|uniref:Uncharacterized protein n=2 Tax=Xanthomonas boreopolis TaxID=86183 RepID=A0A919F7D9_9XANT|nr:hypothetical protein GCM10009090_15390 [[Pseudomonas] boreopolis]